jgi:hypothetical protein
MADVLTVEVTIGSKSVPAPPVIFSERVVQFPSFGPIEGVDVDYGPFTINLPTLELPTFSLVVPEVGLDETEPPTFRVGPIPVPEVRLPRLEKAFIEISAEEVGIDVTVLDPFRTQLVGGEVDTRQEEVVLSFPEPIPEVEIGARRLEFGGDVLSLPSFEIPGLEINTPTVPEVTLPDVTVPTDISLEGSVDVADPTSLQANVTLDLEAIRSFVLEPVPGGLLDDPLLFVLSEAVDRLTSDGKDAVVRALREVTNALLVALTSEETRERLSDRVSDREP